MTTQRSMYVYFLNAPLSRGPSPKVFRGISLRKQSQSTLNILNKKKSRKLQSCGMTQEEPKKRNLSHRNQVWPKQPWVMFAKQLPLFLRHL